MNFFSQLPRYTLHVSRRRGFTLIELLVVVGIMVIITSVILVRYSAYNSSTLLTNLAYEIAITIREAQVQGISVGGAGGTFLPGYGAYFADNQPTAYFLFRDLDNNNRMTDSNSDGIMSSADAEFVKEYRLRGHRITDVCITVGSTPDCSITNLSVLFKRPNPDAIVNGNASAAASVVVQADNNSTSQRTIHVFTTGQISIANP
jgi:prepilin-type N-terminal cleavage/methylation domain-containing protein